MTILSFVALCLYVLNNYFCVFFSFVAAKPGDSHVHILKRNVKELQRKK